MRRPYFHTLRVVVGFIAATSLPGAREQTTSGPPLMCRGDRGRLDNRNLTPMGHVLTGIQDEHDGGIDGEDVRL